MSDRAVTAEQLMKRDLTSVMPEDTVEEALQVLRCHGVTGVPVVDGNWRLASFLSETDILQSALPPYLEILAQDSFLYGEQNFEAERRRWRRARDENSSHGARSAP